MKKQKIAVTDSPVNPLSPAQLPLRMAHYQQNADALISPWMNPYTAIDGFFDVLANTFAPPYCTISRWRSICVT